MIVDRIENLKLYIPYNEKLRVVCDYLEHTDIYALEAGRHEVDEAMGYLPLCEVEEAEYDEVKDVSHPSPRAGAKMSVVSLETGCFAFLEPRDAHRPSAKLHAEAAKKLIFKIPVVK